MSETAGLHIVHGSRGRAEVPRLRSLAEILANPAALLPPRVIVPRLAWAGRVTLFAAREKAGKSTLLVAGASAASVGAPFLGEQTGLADTVWYSADGEADADLARRFVRFGAKPSAVWIPEGRPSLAELYPAIVGMRPRLFVVDTLTSATAERVRDANAPTDWTAILLELTALARATEAAIVLLHHASKSTGNYRDSTAIGAGVDVIVEMTAPAEDDALRALKAKGRWDLEAAFRVRLVGDSYELDSNAPSLDARVLALVQESPGLSTKAVRAGVDGRDEEVIGSLRRLERSGMVKDQGSGRCHSWHVGGGVPGVPRAPEQPAARGVPGPTLLGPEHQAVGRPAVEPTCGHGEQDWWTASGGNLVCGVCHPRPGEQAA